MISLSAPLEFSASSTHIPIQYDHLALYAVGAQLKSFSNIKPAFVRVFGLLSPADTIRADPMLAEYCPNVYGVEPTLSQTWVNFSCLMGLTLNPANTRRSPNVGEMLAHRLRHWSNITPTMDTVLCLLGPANTKHRPSVVLTLCHRLRRRPNIIPTLGQCFVLAGSYLTSHLYIFHGSVQLYTLSRWQYKLRFLIITHHFHQELTLTFPQNVFALIVSTWQVIIIINRLKNSAWYRR